MDNPLGYPHTHILNSNNLRILIDCKSKGSWNEGLLLGIGKQMNFSKALKGQIIFTYDFLHTSASPSPKAWNIKFGFQLGEFKFKDVRF